jgi:hypothetical protein
MLKVLIMGSVRIIDEGLAYEVREHLQKLLEKEFEGHSVFEVFVTEELLPLPPRTGA